MWCGFLPLEKTQVYLHICRSTQHESAFHTFKVGKMKTRMWARLWERRGYNPHPLRWQHLNLHNLDSMRFTTYLGSRAISRGEEKSKRKLIFQESWDRLSLFTSSRTTLGFWEVGPRVPRIKLVQLFKHYGANKLQMKDQWVGLLGQTGLLWSK